MPSMAFAVKVPARLPLVPFTRVSLTTPQTSLHAADRSVATPSTSVVAPLRRWHLDQRREPRYQGPWRLPGPDFHRLAALSLTLGYVMTSSPMLRRPSCWTHTST
jgi:hypothetical protein